MSISDFSFDDGDRSLTSNTKRLKFKNGETVRISFAWFPKGDDGKYDLKTNPKFRGANRVWVNGVGYVVANSPEIASITGATPKMSIATVVVVWPTDKNGNIDKNRMKNGDCDVMPWVFSKRKYSEFESIGKRVALWRTRSQTHLYRGSIPTDKPSELPRELFAEIARERF